MNIAKLLTIACAMVVLGATAGTATAENITYKSNPNVSTIGNSSTWVDITETGATELAFFNPKAGLVSVTFSAECIVSDSASTNWLTVDILIDGVAVQPTEGIDDAFCSDPMTGKYNYATQSITVAKRLSRGSHTVKVQAYLYTAGNGWLDDKTLLVAR